MYLRINIFQTVHSFHSSSTGTCMSPTHRWDIARLTVKVIHYLYFYALRYPSPTRANMYNEIRSRRTPVQGHPPDSCPREPHRCEASSSTALWYQVLPEQTPVPCKVPESVHRPGIYNNINTTRTKQKSESSSTQPVRRPWSKNFINTGNSFSDQFRKPRWVR